MIAIKCLELNFLDDGQYEIQQSNSMDSIKNYFGFFKCTYFKALEEPYKSAINKKCLLYITFYWPIIMNLGLGGDI
jgi:hypothetical protein